MLGGGYYTLMFIDRNAIFSLLGRNFELLKQLFFWYKNIVVRMHYVELEGFRQGRMKRENKSLE